MKFKVDVLILLGAAVFVGLLVMTLMWQDIHGGMNELRAELVLVQSEQATTTQNQLQLAVGLAGVTAKQSKAQTVSNLFVETYNADRSEILNDLTSLQLKQAALEVWEVSAVESVAALNTMCPDKVTMERVATYADIIGIFWAGLLAVGREQLSWEEFGGFMRQALQLDPELLLLFEGGYTYEVDPGWFIMRLETKFAAAVANAFEPCQLD